MNLAEPSASAANEPGPDAMDPIDTASRELGRLLDAIRASSAVIQDLFTGLATHSEPFGVDETALRAELDRRDELAREVGVQVVRAALAGASIQVAAPARAAPPDPPALAPAPPPAPPVPSVRTGGSLAAEALRAPVNPVPARVTPADPARATTPSESPTTVPFSSAFNATPVAAPPRSAAARPPIPLSLTPSTAPVRTRDAAREIRTPDNATPRRATPRPEGMPQRTADLKDVLTAIGRPVQAADPATANAAASRLMDATADLDAWLVFPTNTQRSLVGLASSVARHLQDEAGDQLDGDATRALRSWFPVMSHWSKLYRPGFVPGLSRRFGPERDSWLEDAEFWWNQLQDGPDLLQRTIRTATPYSWMSRTEEGPTPAEALSAVEAALVDPAGEPVKPIEQLLEVGVSHRDPRLLRIVLQHTERVLALPGLKTLKAAIRDASTPDDDLTEGDEIDDPRQANVPPDWAYFDRTEGKQAVMIGGDPRQDAADRIRAAFRFGKVDWEGSDPRRVDALAGRVRSGTVELVILLRGYLAHRNSEVLVAACKESGVPYVLVDTGYGVAQVRRAVERYLGQRSTPS